jgi:hypothetical protein
MTLLLANAFTDNKQGLNPGESYTFDKIAIEFVFLQETVILLTATKSIVMLFSTTIPLFCLLSAQHIHLQIHMVSAHWGTHETQWTWGH